jgi:hypothetical protein
MNAMVFRASSLDLGQTRIGLVPNLDLLGYLSLSAVPVLAFPAPLSQILRFVHEFSLFEQTRSYECILNSRT